VANGRVRVLRGRSCLFFLAAASWLAAPGCSIPRPVHTYEYVTHYERMTDSYDPLCSLVYMPPNASLEGYRHILVGEIQVGKLFVESPQTAAGYATVLRTELCRQLAALGTFDTVGMAANPQAIAPQPHGSLLLEGMITRFSMGSGLLRYLSWFLPFLQSSATDLQFEGRIVEADTHRLVLEFVDRRRHLGNTPWGPNPQNFHKGFAMRVTTLEMAKCLAMLVKNLYAQGPPLAASCPAGRSSTRL